MNEDDICHSIKPFKGYVPLMLLITGMYYIIIIISNNADKYLK